MSSQSADPGPVQLLLVGFKPDARFRGEIAAEFRDLRGRGLIRVIDARGFHRTPDGELTELDLGPAVTELKEHIPLARLFALAAADNGAPPDAVLARTVGFSVDDLSRLTEEIEPGDYGLAVLVEHLWASHLREATLHASGRLIGQGFLTHDVMMIVGTEIQARREALAALELAQVARSAALLEALQAFATRGTSSAEERTRAAAEVVRVLVERELVHDTEAGEAIAALTAAGLLDAQVVEDAAAEVQLLADEDAFSSDTPDTDPSPPG